MWTAKILSCSNWQPSLPAGVCDAAAAHGHAHDDPQLLLHHPKPAGPGHATVSRLHPTVLALAHAQPPAREPCVTPRPPRPSQQPPWPLIRHAVLLNFVQGTDTTAAATKVSAEAATAVLDTLTYSVFPKTSACVFKETSESVYFCH